MGTMGYSCELHNMAIFPFENTSSNAEMFQGTKFNHPSELTFILFVQQKENGIIHHDKMPYKMPDLYTKILKKY